MSVPSTYYTMKSISEINNYSINNFISLKTPNNKTSRKNLVHPREIASSSKKKTEYLYSPISCWMVFGTACKMLNYSMLVKMEKSTNFCLMSNMFGREMEKKCLNNK